MLNRSSSVALAAMSRLAESHVAAEGPLTSARIAADRNQPQPFVAKVLTTLSQRGLVKGSPGRNGGYVLTRAPDKIALLDITDCFERQDKKESCPFGSSTCVANSPPCPLHGPFESIRIRLNSLLAETLLSVFSEAHMKP